MYNTLMKHYEDGRSFFWVYLHRHVAIVYGGNWFEEHIRVFISAEHYENLITDILKSEAIFFKTILLHWTIQNVLFKSESEVWMELKPDGCCCKNLKDYYSRKCTLNQSNENVLHFFHNKWHEKCIWFTFDFFTERDGLNGYFWLQFIEKGLISDV